jgi:hypothetical protein
MTQHSLRVKEIGRVGVEPIILAQAESSSLVNGVIRTGFHKRQGFFSLLTFTALQGVPFYSVFFVY